MSTASVDEEVRTPARAGAWGLGVVQRADVRVLAAAALAAVLTDLAVRSGVAGLAGALLVGAVIGGMLLSGRLVNPQAWAVVAASSLFGVWLVLRMSPWLLPLDIVAIAGLLTIGASLARGGSVGDLPIPEVLTRALHAVGHGIAAPSFLAAPVERRSSGAVLRGVVLALPLLVVLGLLLASADAIFADFFRWWSPVTVIEHTVLLAVGAWGMGGLLRVTSAEAAPRPPPVPFHIGHVEAIVVLGALVRCSRPSPSPSSSPCPAAAAT